MFSLFMSVYADTAEVATDTANAAGTAGMLTSFLPLILMIVVFYFLLIRPQRKKEKELKNMINSLKVNDEIATIGGIHGKIVRVKDDVFVIESGIGATKSFITVDRGAVSRFTKRGDEAPKPLEIEEDIEAPIEDTQAPTEE